MTTGLAGTRLRRAGAPRWGQTPAIAKILPTSLNTAIVRPLMATCLLFARGNFRDAGNGGERHRLILTSDYGYCGDRRTGEATELGEPRYTSTRVLTPRLAKPPAVISRRRNRRRRRRRWRSAAAADRTIGRFCRRGNRRRGLLVIAPRPSRKSPAAREAAYFGHESPREYGSVGNLVQLGRALRASRSDRCK